MRINKHFLQAIAALWILVFHLWICLSSSLAELFWIRIGYVGVDIFFFVSAYTLAEQEISYGNFLKSRVLPLYLRFLSFILIVAIYKGWSLLKCVKTASFISFYENGGGSFLWFLPAIILFYLTYPLFLKCHLPYKIAWLLAIWFGCNLFLGKIIGYWEIFIFTNRIPVILAGYMIKKYSPREEIFYLGLPAGLTLLFFGGFQFKLHEPFHDFYFVLGLPFVTGLAALSCHVKKHFIITNIAKASLEIYALQMIFGADLATFFYRITENRGLTNLLVLLSLIGSSVLCAKGYSHCCKLFQKKHSIL